VWPVNKVKVDLEAPPAEVLEEAPALPTTEENTMSSYPTPLQHLVLKMRRQVGPGMRPEDYETQLGVDRATLHEAVMALNMAGLLDTDSEMGSQWLGPIE
jgi:hypothetical protein